MTGRDLATFQSDWSRHYRVTTMFSDIREGGTSYESSSDSDSNDESTSCLETFFLPPSSTSKSTNFNNINMPNHSTAEISNVANRVQKVLDCMSAVDLDLTGFLDALSWGDLSCFNNPKIWYARSTLLKSKHLSIILHRWWKPLSTLQSPSESIWTLPKIYRMCWKDYLWYTFRVRV